MMKSPIRNIALLASTLLACTWVAHAGAAKPPAGTVYVLTDLGGGSAVKASNPDSSGAFFIAGSGIGPNGLQEARVWEVTTAGAILAVTDLGTLPGESSSFAVDVNDSGVVVGSCFDNTNNTQTGFVDVPGIGMLALPSLGGAESIPVAVNNAGVIVGSARDAAQVDWGAMWHVDPAGTITGPVSLGLFFPADINDGGEIVGLVDHPGGALAAIASFDANNVLQVTTIGTPQPNAINNLGEVVGIAHTQVAPLSYLVSAYRWTAATGMTDLGNLGSNKDTEAYDVSDNHQIVGTSSISGKQGTIQHGFVWQNGKMTDLNSVLSLKISAYIVSASGINATGHIVSILSNGHACLLTPH